MHTEAAVLHVAGQPMVVESVDLDDAGSYEVLVRLVACGVCHTDLHMAGSGSMLPMPVVLGHEGAGVVEAVGPAVSRYRVGDRVLTSLHTCGRCLMCAAGRMHLCEQGPTGQGSPEHGAAHAADGSEVFRFGAGAFARHAVVHENALLPAADEVPLDLGCLLACGVSTGWGAVVNRAVVSPGESVVVWGCGGVGMAAIAGAVHSGASRIVAVDSLPWKTAHACEQGATHAVGGENVPLDEMAAAARSAAGPRGADVVIVTVGQVTKELFAAACWTTGVGGRLVTVSGGLGASLELPADLNIAEKTIMGSLMGSASPQHTIAQLSQLYQAGKLDLEAFVTARYPLEHVNDACSDLLAGKNIRGVLLLE